MTDERCDTYKVTGKDNRFGEMCGQFRDAGWMLMGAKDNRSGVLPAHMSSSNLSRLS